MSGHSHFATIRRTKEAKDAVRGKVFSKMGRAISIAVKIGGSPDPETNYKLRMAIDSARAVNMPKANIERAISQASSSGDLQEVVYEGYAPFGVSVIVEVATDNRNRTAQEMKNLFEKSGGVLGGPGSVAFNFVPKTMLVVNYDPLKKDDQELLLIDLGAEDIEDEDGDFYIYVSQEKGNEYKEKIEKEGFVVKSFSLIRKPINLQVVEDPDKYQKVLNFIEALDDHEDVQKVFSNLSYI